MIDWMWSGILQSVGKGGTSKNIVIPSHICRFLNLQKGDKMQIGFDSEKKQISIRKAEK